MSIDDSRLNGKVSGRDIVITVENNHPLIQLAQALNWEDLAEILVPDFGIAKIGGKKFRGMSELEIEI